MHHSFLIERCAPTESEVQRFERGLVDALALDGGEVSLVQFEDFLEACFGAEMAVELANDGPFTLVIDSERDLG